MISIIIPIFNAGDRLKVMLDSVLSQSYSDYEVILVDDGSLDQSGTICDSYASKDDRFKVIHQTQKGPSEARNHGLRIASGDYVAFLDADDEIPVNYLSELIEAIKQSDVDIAVCDVAMIEDGNELSRFTLESGRLSKTEAMNFLLSRKYINSGPCAKLFRKKIIDGLSFPGLDAYEDIVFVQNAFDRASYVGVTSKTEYRYIRNKNGIMSQFTKEPSLDIVKASENLVDYIENHSELSSDCLYATLSHLFQHTCKGKITNKKEKLLNRHIRLLFRKHWISIIKCDAFSLKEKILFLSFGLGFDFR